MLHKIVGYFHHLFNPHCQHCKELDFCANCETLREILSQERYEKQKLVQLIVDINTPKVSVPEEPKEMPQPIPSRYIPWRMRQSLLEAEDRRKAQIMKGQGLKTTDELEKELLNQEKENAGEKREAI